MEQRNLPTALEIFDNTLCTLFFKNHTRWRNRLYYLLLY
jgi:hypothetical protein